MLEKDLSILVVSCNRTAANSGQTEVLYEKTVYGKFCLATEVRQGEQAAKYLSQVT